jgi:hypothetical protein
MKPFLFIALATLTSAITPAAATQADERALDLQLVRGFLLDDHPYTNLFQINSVPGLRARTVSQLPWISSYMPAVMGYAGAPTSGQSAIDLLLSFPFGTGYDLFTSQRMPQLMAFRQSMTESQLDTLAPSEKYDLITGLIGTEQSLTYQLWQQAKQNNDRDGLSTWTGMCNGWSPASIVMKRPAHRIYVPSSDGRFMVPFYPDDIKQLASALFFNTTAVESEMRPEQFNIMGKMPMVGKRCNRKNVRRDDSGFILDPECEDVTPHFWHIAIINLIGKQDQALVADIDSRAKVANYPLRGYEYGYFNPDSGKEGTFDSSRVLVSRFGKDVFKAHRSPLAQSVVGVKMKVSHTGFRLTDHSVEDGPENDTTDTFELIYDLELAENGDIVGGQWRTTRDNVVSPLFGSRPSPLHPDFIWYPPKAALLKGAVAILPSAGTYNSSRIGYTGQFDESASGDWDPSEPTPALWRQQAQLATQVKVDIAVQDPDGKLKVYPQIRPQPLGKIIYGLIEQAADSVPGPVPGLAPSEPGLAPSPVIRAKVSLLQGVFDSTERCNSSFSASMTHPVQYRVPYVRNGASLDFEPRFTFVAATLPDSKVQVTVWSSVYIKGKAEPHSNRVMRVVLSKGGHESVGVDFWYGDFAPMQNHFEIELSYEGQGESLSPSPHPRKSICGQVFLAP